MIKVLSQEVDKKTTIRFKFYHFNLDDIMYQKSMYWSDLFQIDDSNDEIEVSR